MFKFRITLAPTYLVHEKGTTLVSPLEVFTIEGNNVTIFSAADDDYLVVKTKDGATAFMAPAHTVRTVIKIQKRQPKALVLPLVKVK